MMLTVTLVMTQQLAFELSHRRSGFMQGRENHVKSWDLIFKISHRGKNIESSEIFLRLIVFSHLAK